MRLRLISLVTVVMVGALATAASAQDKAGDKPDYAKAKEHYIKASKALDQGDFAIAAREFGAAYQITKDPILFYKIAESHDKAGDCESALIYYGRYLREANPTGGDKATAEQAVTACKENTGGGGAGGGGTGDGGGTGGGSGDGGDILAPDLGDDDVPPPDDGGDKQPTFLDDGTSWQRTAAWVSVGVAVAAATTGAVLGLSASSREEDINTLIDFRDPVNGMPREYEGEVQRQYDNFHDEGEDLERYSAIAFGVAGVGAVAAVVFFIIDPGPGAGSGGGDDLSYRPRVTPVVGDDTVGVSAGWRF